MGIYASWRMLLVFFLGFSSGLPLMLVGSTTLQAWLTDSKIDLPTIGRFALVGLPYTLKFVWAPFLDSYRPPFLSRRKGWGLIIQVGLVASLVAMAFTDPSTGLGWFAFFAALAAFFSASQDIVIDALRIEILRPDEMGAGAGIHVTGYRIATLVSGAVALAMADHMSFTVVYLAMAAVQCIGIPAVLLAPEPDLTLPPYTRFKDRILVPFLDFLRRHGAMEMLLFVMLYKLSTLMATALTTTFLIKLEFTKTEIAWVGKGFGFVATIVGTLIGGGMMARIGLKRSLWAFGVLQGVAGLAFIVLSESLYGLALPRETVEAVLPTHWVMLKNILAEPRHFAMMWVVIVDNFMMGLGTAALLGFSQAVCSKQFAGTQFALLSSLTAVSRVILISQAGTLAEKLGWTGFFVFSMLLAIPGLALLIRYDQWTTSDTGARERISRADLSALGLILVSLVLLVTEPLWGFFGRPDLGSRAALAGAIGVVVAVLFGLFRPRGPASQQPAAV
jgi:MFS transporter, PAT family, beta-lactamase induction signal transducer AmpG